jgi:hypothetical protein
MTATLWNVAAFGWTCIGRHQVANTTVDTWTAGHDVLVLVWENEATVVAGVLNGEVIEHDEIGERVANGPADESVELFARAAQHVDRGEGRMSTELARVFEAARKVSSPNLTAIDGGPVLPLRLRTTLHHLALAVLSTPAG